MRASGPDAHYLAGGTNLLDLMKGGVETPARLVDVGRVALSAIGPAADSPDALSIGGTAKNSDTANHPFVRERLPLISQAILAGASAQIRNMATNGGNLNQRTRCPYFYEPGLPCNKRAPGTGCSALEGVNREHAIFGWSDACVATHPSDMCVALVALDAVVHLLDRDGGARELPFDEYHRLPGDDPRRDNRLRPGEMVTAITVPANALADRSCYAAPNRALAQQIVFLNINQPTNMRGPGETTGIYALECAMDELAHGLGLDPLELRRRNEPETEPITGKTFSCRRLIECMEQGAAAFGWERRRQTPATWREGDHLIGYGYASTTYPLKGSPCQVRCRVRADGAVVMESSTHDFGNGISTSARQIAAEALGVRYEDVDFRYADSDLPRAMQTGGSTTTMWIGTAIKSACEQVLHELNTLRVPVHDGASGFASGLRSLGRDEIQATATAGPDKAKAKTHSMNSFGAHFCEVAVDADTGAVQVRRFLSAINCGRIINPKLATSQYIGAVTMGIGMALAEGNELDPRHGMWMNADLADYHVPVYADVHSKKGPRRHGGGLLPARHPPPRHRGCAGRPPWRRWCGSGAS